MSTSELHKSQPILALLAPTGANGAPFGQPTQGAFHYPTASRVFVLIWNGIRRWFTTATPVGDMSLIAGQANETMNIG